MTWHLRRAIEPWPLLGEQPTPGGGLVRCVDSSTERLEIRIFEPTGTDLKSPPFTISINGWKLPLTPYPISGGGFLGAVRFRNILLPTSLHPHVSIQTPLLIQISDDEGAVLGAWNYHPRIVAADKKSPYLTAAEKSPKRLEPRSYEGQGECKTLDLLAVPLAKL